MVRALYECEVCGYIYVKREDAEECEKFCSEHHACNREILKRAYGRKNG